MKTYKNLFFLFFISQLISSCTTTLGNKKSGISGRITNAEGVPFSNISVAYSLVRPKFPYLIYKLPAVGNLTSDDGFYSLPLPPGEYDIYFYIKKKEKVTIKVKITEKKIVDVVIVSM